MVKNLEIKIFITLTWSKIMALIILIMSFILDLLYDKSGRVFMFAVPFVVFLISGRQYINFLKVNKGYVKLE